MRKKILGMLLAATMAVGCLTGVKPVKADDTYKFEKQYKLKAGDDYSKSPEETFTFENAQLSAIEKTSYNTTAQKQDISELSNANIPEDVKEVKIGSVSFDKGAAVKAGVEKEVTVTPPTAATYQSSGYYYYKFKENKGDTAGVTYNENTFYIRVAVTYDSANEKYEINSVAIMDKDMKKVAGIENGYSAGEIAIEKVVTGNMANNNETFDVTVTFKPADGTKLRSDITASINDTALGDVTITGDENEKKATFKVKAGTKVSFKNLPEGVTYTVEEIKANGYDDPAYKINGTAGNEGTIVGGKSDSVIITNNRQGTIDNGVFMSNLPYLLVLAFAGACGVVFVVRRKH